MSDEAQKPQPNSTLVWDISTRIFHWSLVLLVLFQWLSGELFDDMIDWHVISGYTVLGLAIFRLIWGFVGPKYVRFSQFTYRPKAILNYANTLFERDSEAHASHNPMGGIAVFAMLFLLMIQAVSGLFISDDIFTSGPYHSAVSSFWQETFTTIHGLAFDALKIIIALHILVIIYYGHYKKQRLIAAMIHGKKPIKAKPIKSHKLLSALLIAVLVAIFIYLLVSVWPPVEDTFYDF